MTTRVPVTFEPAGVTSWVAPGATVLDAARLAGIVIAAPCGGRGVCGSCGIRVTSGELDAPDDVETLCAGRGGSGVRLACRARVSGPVTIRPVVLNPALTHTPTAGATRHVSLVAGVDLGTTSIAAVLIDRSSGLELARSSVPNPQQSYGSDLLSRLSAALSGSALELRTLAEQGVSSALEAAAIGAGASLAGVERLVVAGNSAMAALLVGADTSTLAVHPFSPPAIGTIPADSSLRMTLAPDAEVVVLPPIAGFVGGDALAATLSAGMIEAAGPMLLIDFGTNAEIVLAGSGPLVVASAAAGPAFEGVGISCGGPAAVGAVTGVRIGDDGSVHLETLGSGAPLWLSGSGFVSVLAELRRLGHVASSGLLLADGPLARHFRKGEGDVLAVGLGDETAGCLGLTQLDIRALQLAKGAVRAGIQAVLAAGGVTAADLEEVLVAGAFGSALEPADLVALGVLPIGVAAKTVRVGNASLDGAAIIALDPGMFELAVSAAQAARHVDLAADEGFGRALVDATEFAPYSI